MTPHPSPLVLDEVAADLAPAPPHLASCLECQEKLERLKAARHAFLAKPQAQQLLEKLHRAPARRTQRRLFKVAAVAAPLAVAAGLLLFLHGPSTNDELDPSIRIKGAPAVLLLDAAGRSVTRASPGQTLTLAVGAAGYSHAAVFSVDASGKRQTLWPTNQDTYGKVPPGPRAQLVPLEVTPGSVTLHAAFAREALHLTQAGEQTATMRLAVE